MKFVYTLWDNWREEPVWQGIVFQNQADAEAVQAVLRSREGVYARGTVVQEVRLLDVAPTLRRLHQVEIRANGDVISHRQTDVWSCSQETEEATRKFKDLHGDFVRAESFVSRDDAIWRAMEFWARQ